MGFFVGKIKIGIITIKKKNNVEVIPRSHKLPGEFVCLPPSVGALKELAARRVASLKEQLARRAFCGAACRRQLAV